MFRRSQGNRPWLTQEPIITKKGVLDPELDADKMSTRKCRAVNHLRKKLNMHKMYTKWTFLDEHCRSDFSFQYFTQLCWWTWVNLSLGKLGPIKVRCRTCKELRRTAQKFRLSQMKACLETAARWEREIAEFQATQLNSVRWCRCLLH